MTDNKNEVFDEVNENDKPIGQITRGQAHGNPKLIHRSIAIAIFNGKKELFLQKRSKTKDTEPDKWSISCSGHVESGKYYEETAHRELMEELGVDLKIHPKDKLLIRYPWETEMTKLFVAFSEGPFTLNKEEISEGKFFSANSLKEQLKDEDIVISKLLDHLLPYIFPETFFLTHIQ